MSFFEIFKNTKKDASASMAKERLQIIVAHERATRDGPDYLPALQRDILEVVRRYISINPEDVAVNFDSLDDYAILELNVTLPETAPAQE
ncbi:cell division topological specificity factor MinE [Zooshikella marina]|uniref:Cell division topological specificity factor n=1 Tax=Zooshikella ganghwensis TaxID=202772 RepID=A0A4P9VLZ0_9GAMM|nr:cell division topological specificity factor MinE [Zooshikella ganghwensis]MBU2704661.1 cell division topological specificity factor MinE [Zooshikella ganghwensis]RDH43120.1 cell division topological specificity factor MinE [Zooshikella ganghwensis]